MHFNITHSSRQHVSGVYLCIHLTEKKVFVASTMTQLLKSLENQHQLLLLASLSYNWETEIACHNHRKKTPLNKSFISYWR